MNKGTCCESSKVRVTPPKTASLNRALL